MKNKDYPYLCNNCGEGLTENARCGTYMKCYSCGNSGKMVEVAVMNNLESKAENHVVSSSKH